MAGGSIDGASPAVTALAILGAIAWSLQLIPQIYLNYTRHSTEGLHSSMMILWSIAGLPLAIHNILSGQHIALQIQAEVLTGLSLVTWAQTMYYGKKWSIKKSIYVTAMFVLAFVAVQTGFIVGFKHGNVPVCHQEKFILATAILAAVLLSLGVLRHYWDIYEERTVRGISWGFVFLDALGDLASLLAILLRSPIDRFAMGIYASELTLWIGIIIAGLVYNLPRAISRRFRRSSNEMVSSFGEETAVAEDDDQMSVFRSIQAENTRLPSFRMRKRVTSGPAGARSSVETGPL